MSTRPEVPECDAVPAFGDTQPGYHGAVYVPRMFFGRSAVSDDLILGDLTGSLAVLVKGVQPVSGVPIKVRVARVLPRP